MCEGEDEGEEGEAWIIILNGSYDYLIDEVERWIDACLDVVAAIFNIWLVALYIEKISMYPERQVNCSYLEKWGRLV